MTKQHPRMPDTTMHDRLTAAGFPCRLLWTVQAPVRRDSTIDWISAYAVHGRLVLVTTFKPTPHGEPGGWDVFTAIDNQDVTDTLMDVLERCGVIAAVENGTIRPGGTAA